MTNPTNVKRYYPIILRDQRVQNAAHIATSAVHVVIERYVKVMIENVGNNAFNEHFIQETLHVCNNPSIFFRYNS